jgi:hypothetical protein
VGATVCCLLCFANSLPLNECSPPSPAGAAPAAPCLLICLRQPQLRIQVAAGKVDGRRCSFARKVAARLGTVVWVVAVGVGGGGAQESLAVLRQQRWADGRMDGWFVCKACIHMC